MRNFKNIVFPITISKEEIEKGKLEWQVHELAKKWSATFETSFIKYIKKETKQKILGIRRAYKKTLRGESL